MFAAYFSFIQKRRLDWAPVAKKQVAEAICMLWAEAGISLAGRCRG